MDTVAVVGEIIPIFVFYFFYLTMREYYMYHSRKQLIQLGKIDEDVKYLFMKSASSAGLNTLKWGFVAIGLGLSLLISFAFTWALPDALRGMVTLGLMSLFGGLGLVTYYVISRKLPRE